MKPGGRNEYLLALLAGALAAFERGDYPIGAIAAARYREYEVISVGANSMFSQTDPRGHAEANALGRLLALARVRPHRNVARLAEWPGVTSLDASETVVYYRPLCKVEDPGSSILYASLEPCPMCTVVLLNAGVSRVVIAEHDRLAGALSSRGVHHMPALWADLARSQGLRVEYIHPSHGDDQVGSTVVSKLSKLFAAARPQLDQYLSTGGLLAHRSIAARIERKLLKCKTSKASADEVQTAPHGKSQR